MEETEFFRISYPCKTCERIIHIIQRRELERKSTCKADLQEFIFKERGNNGRRESLDRHIKDLEKEGYLVPIRDEFDNRRISLRLNMEKIVSSGFSKKIMLCIDPTGPIPFYMSCLEYGDSKIEYDGRCFICGSKVECKVEHKSEDHVYVLDWDEFNCRCSNCGFSFYYNVFW